jgi:hypothetical protein
MKKLASTQRTALMLGLVAIILFVTDRLIEGMLKRP